MCQNNNSDPIFQKAICKSCKIKIYLTLIIGAIILSLLSILLLGYLPFNDKIMYAPFGLWILTLILIGITATHKLFGKGAILGANSIIKDLVEMVKSLFPKAE